MWNKLTYGYNGNPPDIDVQRFMGKHWYLVELYNKNHQPEIGNFGMIPPN